VRREGPDPLARRTALAIGAGRIALGAAALFATSPTLRAMRLGETDAAGEALAKVAGGRDVAIGVVTLTAAGDPRRLRALTVLGAAVDAADAIAFGLAALRPERAAGKLGGVISGAGAAAAGAWAARRL
jgi:hypothetical protein